jgi:hypothetical protein
MTDDETIALRVTVSGGVESGDGFRVLNHERKPEDATT